MIASHLLPGKKGNSERSVMSRNYYVECGGQAAIAAVKTKRHYLGYDINEEYVKLAIKRIEEFSLSFNAPKLFDF